jgi:hypothetical protein
LFVIAIVLSTDTGDVLLRTPYEYKFVLQNRGEIDGHFTLVPSPSVSMEIARMEMEKGHVTKQFDVSGRKSMEEKKIMKEKRDEGVDVSVKTPAEGGSSTHVVSSTSLTSLSSSQNEKPSPKRTMSFLKASQRGDIDPGSLALRAPPTTSEVMKATRPPLILTPEVGIIPPHSQINVKVSFFPERCGIGK